jgi:hypothetical protein
MTRLSKFLLPFTLIVFILACNTVTKPIKDVQNVAGTVESVGSALPVETLKAFATNMPIQTLQAVSSAIPELENQFKPQGAPVTDWNNIPIMTDATAGQEYSSTSYSFSTPSTASAVQDFYDARLKDLGWGSLFGSQVSDQGGLLLFQKDNALLTITIVTNPDGDKDTIVNFQLISQ